MLKYIQPEPSQYRKVFFMNKKSDADNFADTLSAISHELKTPVNLISATARIGNMRLENGPVDSKDIVQYFKNIINNCNKLELMLNNFMSVASLSLNSFELVDTQDFIDSFTASINEYAQKHNFTFTAKIAPECEFINIPVLPVERILLNLITNAVKYNSKKSKKVSLKVYRENKSVFFSVKDNGNGIKKDEIPNITKKFHRVDTGNASGLGLGLNIVETILKQLGGTLEFISKPKVGTEVIISIPDGVKGTITLNSNQYIYTPSKSLFDVEFSTLYNAEGN